MSQGNQGRRSAPQQHRQPREAAVKDVVPPPAPAGHHDAHHHAHVRVTEDFLSQEKFSTNPRIPDPIRKAIVAGFGYDSMTKVQAASIPLAIEGMDLLAKAQTGTGKTIAFLVPCIERVQRERPSGAAITAVIVSPTRELAMQIHEECEVICKGLRNVRSLCVYGGTSINRDRDFLRGQVDILIATPGRFCDHLGSTDGFLNRLRGVKMFVMDEADRMLDMGFRNDVEKILASLPTNRQTLLFSATVPQEIVKIAPEVLSAEFLLVDAKSGRVTRTTARSGSKTAEQLVADDPLATASQVEQSYLICRLQEQMDLVFDLLDVEHQKPNHKIIVYFTTARLAQLFAETSVAMGLPTLEIHSRKSQAQRQRASDNFKDGTNVTLFSSDVTARGMDYPDVTFVLQVSAPTDVEQYVHRLGRTARAGKQGRGVLLLLEEEEYFLKELKVLPVHKGTYPPQAKWRVTPFEALAKIPYETKACAYAAWLGFYNGMCSRMRWSKERLVKEANYFATNCLNLESPPELQKKTIGKMGLKGVPGLVVEGERGGRGGGSGRGGGRGRDAPAPPQRFDPPAQRRDAPPVKRYADPVAPAPPPPPPKAAAGASQGLKIHPSYFGVIIGRKGQTLQEIERESRCRVTVPRVGDDDQRVWIEGASEADVRFAKNLIYDRLDAADAQQKK
jgi:ATP-dependent RNA helicase MSS116